MWYKTENGQLRTGECNLPKLQNIFKMNIRVKNVLSPIPILVDCGWGKGIFLFGKMSFYLKFSTSIRFHFNS